MKKSRGWGVHETNTSKPIKRLPQKKKMESTSSHPNQSTCVVSWISNDSLFLAICTLGTENKRYIHKLWLVGGWTTHVKNMLVKIASSSPRFGVKIPKNIWNLNKPFLNLPWLTPTQVGMNLLSDTKSYLLHPFAFFGRSRLRCSQCVWSGKLLKKRH